MDEKNDCINDGVNIGINISINDGLNNISYETLPIIRQQLTSQTITRSTLNIMDEEFAGHLLHQSSLWANEELLTDLLTGEQVCDLLCLLAYWSVNFLIMF